MEKKKSFINGLALSMGVGLMAIYFSKFVPKNIISPSVFALLIGMIISYGIKSRDKIEIGVNFVSKKVLRLAIILMGFNLNLKDIFNVGKYSIFVMVFTLFTAFFFGYIIGKLFKMDWKLSSLISAGTGICGGSAIASLAPVIEASPSQVAYSISATFLFDIIMVILFPIAGKYLGMSDLGFGLWTGTAVNDTSSVVAAGYAFSDQAGNFALIVKLTRTLSIIPVIMIFSLINSRLTQESGLSKKPSFGQVFPWFILLFLVSVAINSLGIIPTNFASGLAQVSKFFMVLSLGGIGINSKFQEISKAGFLPMIHGFIISLLVVVVSFAVQLYIGQI